MKILVTGASGFVGGALVRKLRIEGHKVVALGRRSLEDEDYFSCDLANGLHLDFVPDVVVHAAARSSPWGSRSVFEAQNVRATQSVINFCEAKGRPYLLHISTCAVMYENAHQLAMDEGTPLPDISINTYAATKREAETRVQSYSGPSCILRPRAIFGPGDTVVFPRILRAARGGRLPVIESPVPVQADLIYIETFIDYIIRAIEKRAVGLYLVTNNQPVPILPFLDDLFGQLGIPKPTRRVPVGRAMAAATFIEGLYRCVPFLGEPPITRFGVSAFAYSKTFNVQKALRDLGFPSVSLEEGVARFVAWQKTNLP